MRTVRKNQSGFTLIELLMVIVILGILAAVVVFSVSGLSDRGTKAACQADVATVTTAAEAYYAKNGSYPASTTISSWGGFLKTATFPTDVNYTPATGAVSGTAACS
jgi:general secretion pathway protein G